jgi:hypothetical protein
MVVASVLLHILVVLAIVGAGYVGSQLALMRSGL